MTAILAIAVILLTVPLAVSSSADESISPIYNYSLYCLEEVGFTFTDFGQGQYGITIDSNYDPSTHLLLYCMEMVFNDSTHQMEYQNCMIQFGTDDYYFDLNQNIMIETNDYEMTVLAFTVDEAPDPFSVTFDTYDGIYSFHIYSLETSFSDQLSIYQSGYYSGYDVGYDAGWSSGYDSGFTLGFGSYEDSAEFEEALSRHYQEGYGDGYYTGYSDGENDADNGLSNGIFAIVEAPGHMIRSIFNFDVLGINIAGLILGVITVILVVWVVRKILG